MKGKRTGKAFKAYYKNYDWDFNVAQRLERHIKNQPEDEVAKQALNRLKSGKKKYTRNRKSDGHICKVAPSIAITTSRGDDRPTIIDQMVNIGFKYRGRNKKTTRQGKSRVR